MGPLQVAAAQHVLIRERLQALEPDLDERTLADTVEGLTDLHEILGAIIRSALEDESLAQGLKLRIQGMQSRLDRLVDRAGKRRELVKDVMGRSAIQKITAPDFTISLRAGVASLVITNEEAIPSRFWEPRAPRLNRQQLLTELRGGTHVSGCELAPPLPVLNVRTK